MAIRHLEQKISHYITFNCFSCLPGAWSREYCDGDTALLCPVCAPRPASYSVVWLKLGMAMAGDTTALDTVRFTGLNWLTWERECGISDAPERSGQCHLGHDGLDH